MKVVPGNLRVTKGRLPCLNTGRCFDTNDGVFNAAHLRAGGATLLFSVTQNEQIEQLGRYIHIFAPAAQRR